MGIFVIHGDRLDGQVVGKISCLGCTQTGIATSYLVEILVGGASVQHHNVV